MTDNTRELDQIQQELDEIQKRSVMGPVRAVPVCNATAEDIR